MKRITVIMPDEVYDGVMRLVKHEKRSKSAMCAILLSEAMRNPITIIKESNGKGK